MRLQEAVSLLVEGLAEPNPTKGYDLEQVEPMRQMVVTLEQWYKPPLEEVPHQSQELS